jgi:hypothetical protein
MFNRCLRKYKISCCKHRKFIVHFLEQYRNTIRVCSVCATLISIVSILTDYKAINNHEIYYTVFVDVLSDWQTLIAGALALFGAWVTVSTMRKHEADRVYKKSLVSRVQLPDANRQIHTYLKLCFGYALGEEKVCPKYPEAIQFFQDHIQYSDRKTAQSLFRLMCFFQVHRSCMEDWI